MRYIYRILNKVNNKSYIGQSVCNKTRWASHKSAANRIKDGSSKMGDHGIQIVHLAIAKYGAENFSFKVIEEVNTLDEANEREKYWIAVYDSFCNGYNCNEGGSNAKLSKDTKKKISEAMKGCTPWNLGTKGIMQANSGSFAKGHVPWIAGKSHSKESLKKMSKTWFIAGHRASPETEFSKGTRSPKRKLTLKEANEIRSKYAGGNVTYGDLSQEYGVSKSSVGDIIRGKTYIN